MRLVFLGTPEAAVPPLLALAAAGHEIAMVVTRADKRRERGQDLSPSPVKTAALALGVPVRHKVDDALGLGADLGVVVAFGQLVKPHVLAEIPMINLHFSLLPRWRGAAPVERAILAGDAETGVCVMALEEGLDTGGVYKRVVVPIGDDDTSATLRDRLVAAGTPLLVEALSEPLGAPEPQVGEVTYAAKVTPEDLHLDWARPAVELARLPRVGKAWTTFRGRRLLVPSARAVEGQLPPGVIDGVRVGTGDGLIELATVQPEGKAPTDARSWLNGARPQPGERLGG